MRRFEKFHCLAHWWHFSGAGFFLIELCYTLENAVLGAKTLLTKATAATIRTAQTITMIMMTAVLTPVLSAGSASRIKIRVYIRLKPQTDVCLPGVLGAIVLLAGHTQLVVLSFSCAWRFRRLLNALLPTKENEAVMICAQRFIRQAVIAMSWNQDTFSKREKNEQTMLDLLVQYIIRLSLKIAQIGRLFFARPKSRAKGGENWTIMKKWVSLPEEQVCVEVLVSLLTAEHPPTLK